jgi:sortase A
MKKLITLIPALLLTLTAAMPAIAADYEFGTGGGTLDDFGGATSYDGRITPDPLSENVRRNKDSALLPPPFGVFGGDIPTDPSSLYHDSSRESGFVPVGRELPPVGDEDYAQGINAVYIGWLPSTSQTVMQNTAPAYFSDGSIGTLYVHKTGNNISVYEGEDLANLKKGAGHFASTSAWDGNVALAGHNRGSSAYFGFVKDLQKGDTLTYTTRYGVRTYKVYSKTKIDEYDSLPLSWSSENILTLITCVADVPELRYCVVAREAI